MVPLRGVSAICASLACLLYTFQPLLRSVVPSFRAPYHSICYPHRLLFRPRSHIFVISPSSRYHETPLTHSFDPAIGVLVLQRAFMVTSYVLCRTTCASTSFLFCHSPVLPHHMPYISVTHLPFPYYLSPAFHVALTPLSFAPPSSPLP